MSTSDKVYYPEIIETYPLPDTVVETETPAGTYTPKGDFTPSADVDEKFPPKSVAKELIGVSLNTKSQKILGNFTFGQVGAISIGTYESGVSGDIRLTPTGIVARNINGVTTFALDGSTGDAVFLGQVKAGSVVSDGDITISGTGAFVVNDGTYNVIRLGYGSGLF